MIGQFQKWLEAAKNTFLNYWAAKVNRTTVIVFLGTNTPATLRDVTIPKGTWSFEIRNQGDGLITIHFQGGGTVILREQSGAGDPVLDSIFFAGEPYVERDDIFKNIVFDDNDGRLEIVCHRIIPRNS